MNAADPLYMARALELARQGLYSTHPNPRVGCVLVKDGQVVGEAGTSAPASRTPRSMPCARPARMHAAPPPT